MPYRWMYCLLIPYRRCDPKVDLVWAWGDLMNALQVFPNIIRRARAERTRGRCANQSAPDETRSRRDA